MFWLFGPKAREILVPCPGIEPIPPALEGEFLTTWLPGKSLEVFSINYAILKIFFRKVYGFNYLNYALKQLKQIINLSV